MVTDNSEKTIAEVATQYNTTYRTLRFYESIGLIAPRRVGTSRFFSIKDCNRVALILKGKKLGFSLEEIRILISTAASVDQRTPMTIIEGVSPLTIAKKITDMEKERDGLADAIRELDEELTRRRA